MVLFQFRSRNFQRHVFVIASYLKEIFRFGMKLSPPLDLTRGTNDAEKWHKNSKSLHQK